MTGERYRRQYARRKPIERKVRLGIGPVVYNCPVPRWTRKQFLSMWGGVQYIPRYIPPVPRRMDP